MNMINKNPVTLARNGLTKHLYKNKFVLFEIFQQIQDKIQKLIEKTLIFSDRITDESVWSQKAKCRHP